MDQQQQDDMNRMMTVAQGGVQNFPNDAFLIIETVGDNPQVKVKISAYTLLSLLTPHQPT